MNENKRRIFDILKKLMSILLTITMILSTGINLVLADVQSFSDLPREHWAYNDVASLAGRGVINGYTDGSFQPDKVVTRAEAAVMLSRAFAATGNTEEIKTLHKPFADKMYLDESGCGELWYDLDLDGNDDRIEMRQSRSFANSPDGSLNCLKTELVVNGQTLLLGNAYKTHGCRGVFVADIDQSDDYLDIIVLMSYKHINAYVYQYRNGELMPSYCINKDTSQKNEFFNVGGWGEEAKVDLKTAVVSVNDMEWQVPGFTILISGNEYYYKKTAHDEYMGY